MDKKEQLPPARPFHLLQSSKKVSPPYRAHHLLDGFSVERVHFSRILQGTVCGFILSVTVRQ
jgi:hypothetical protein